MVAGEILVVGVPDRISGTDHGDLGGLSILVE
jgi:hypothetical protein